MKTQEPKAIFAHRLVQARKMRGMSLRALAEAIGDKVTYNALHRYELGQMMPGDEVLMAVADVLDQPLDFFFRPFTVKLQEVNFRKRTKLGAKSEEAIREQAADFFERYLEIEQIIGLPTGFQDPLKGVRLSKPADAEKAAETVREKWNLGVDPLPNVLETLETNGIKVFEVEAPGSIDGFAGWTDGQPVIVLAKWLDKDMPRKRLTALHEAAHVLFHEHTSLKGKELEESCYRFGGAMLIPQAVFKTDWGGYRHRVGLEELKDLKRRYGMSIAAIMRRAHDLKLLDSAVYRRFCIMYKTQHWQADGEPGEYIGREASSRFEQLVLRAAAEEMISYSKGAAILNEPLMEFREKLSEFA